MRHFRSVDADIAGTTMSEAVEAAKEAATDHSGGYICFVNAHVSVMTRQNAAVRSAVNGALYAFPDGMPVYLLGKALLGGCIEKVSGPDFLRHMFADGEGRRLRHYFFGASQQTLDALLTNLRASYPGCNIVGAVSPPFRELDDEDLARAAAHMRSCGAQLIWMGLGAPKQELLMARLQDAARPAILLGVGAAFDFHAGTKRRAPRWAQVAGLEWAHRLLQEPGRLWRRYLTTNSLFLWYCLTGCWRPSRLRVKGG